MECLWTCLIARCTSTVNKALKFYHYYLFSLTGQPQRLSHMCTWKISGVFNGIRIPLKRSENFQVQINYETIDDIVQQAWESFLQFISQPHSTTFLSLNIAYVISSTYSADNRKHCRSPVWSVLSVTCIKLQIEILLAWNCSFLKTYFTHCMTLQNYNTLSSTW